MKRLYLLAVLLAPAGLAAQQPQPDFSQFQTLLSQIKLSIRLEWLDKGRQKDSLASKQLIERGLIAMRRYEITNRREDANRAREIFGKATDRYPNLPWAWYGLGIALAHGPDVRIKSPLGVLNKIVIGQSAAQIIGLDPRSRAKRALKHAIELDPVFPAPALELAELSLADQDKDGLRAARDALKRINSQPGPHASVATALSNVDSALGDLTDATDAADAAIAASPTDPSALHARAVALLLRAKDPPSGAQAYFSALDNLTDEAAEEFFHDVVALVADSERVAWDHGDLNAHRAWLRTFWDMRSARAGVSVPERLSEHYQRLSFAQKKYRRKSMRGADPSDALLHIRSSDKLEYDDRGIIYIRHGKPDEVVSSASINLRPNESWVYHAIDRKPQLVHFITLPDAPDFHLVDDILKAVDMSTTGFNSIPVVQLLEDRVAYEPRYGLMIARLQEARSDVMAASMTTRGGTADIMETLTNLGVQAATVSADERMLALNMVRSDSDRPHFDADLPFFYDVYTFRGTKGRTDITAAMAIPGQMLEPRDGNDASYALRLSLIVLDSTAGRVERSDTVFHFSASKPLVAGQHLRTQVQLAATPSPSASYRVVASNFSESISKGQMYGAPLPIPDYSGTHLMLSDIVLAEAEPGGSWKRGKLSLRLVPPRQFPRSKPLTLFYEIYNLAEGAAYRTEVSIFASDKGGGLGKLKRMFGGKHGMSFAFEGTASNADGAIQELRRLAPDLPAGRYRIQVKVTDLASVVVAQKERDFVVMK